MLILMKREKNPMSDTGSQAHDEAAEKEQEVSATETDALGDAGKKALDAERAARRESEKQLKALQEKLESYEDKERSEAEKAARKAEKYAKDLEAANSRIAELEHANLVSEVAVEHGIPTSARHRLMGSTREELEEDAKDLKALLAPEGPRRPAPVREVGRGGSSQVSTADEFAAFFSQELG